MVSVFAEIESARTVLVLFSSDESETVFVESVCALHTRLPKNKIEIKNFYKDNKMIINLYILKKIINKLTHTFQITYYINRIITITGITIKNAGINKLIIDLPILKC